MAVSAKQILFFISMGIFYIVFYVVTSLMSGHIKTVEGEWKKSALFIVFVSACFFSLLTFGYAELTGLFKEKYHESSESRRRYLPNDNLNNNLNDNSNNKPVLPTCKQQINPRFCRGGSYTWQGNSPRAKACRELASTPEGMAQIQRYESGKGFVGMPGRGFNFTPISDASWTNQRCNSPSGYNLEDNGIF